MMLSVIIAVRGDAVTKTEIKNSDANEGMKPRTEMTIIALGAQPPRRYMDQPSGDGPVMMLAQPGKIPPATLYYQEKSASDEVAEWQSWSVALNSVSALKRISAGKVLTLYQKLPDFGGYQKYVSLPAADEGSRRVVFLTASSSGPRPWMQPPWVNIISLTSKNLLGKQLILKNLSRFTVLHAFGGEVASVAPMKTISYKRAHAGELYRIAAQYGRRQKIIYNTAVRLDGRGHTHIFALYNANPGTNSGRSVGVFRAIIPAAPITGEIYR